MDKLEDIIDFVNDKLKISYSFLYIDDIVNNFLNNIFKNLDLDKYNLYKETNWYKFLNKIVNHIDYEFDDNHINYFLGFMYKNGFIVKCDYKKAFEYLKKASKKGNYSATYQLGNMYRHGYHVEIDYSKAIIYYKRSTKQSYSVFDIMDKLNAPYDKTHFYSEIMDKLNIQTIRFQFYEAFPISIRKKVIDQILYEHIDISFMFDYSYIKNLMTIFYIAQKEKLYSDSDTMLIHVISTKQKNLLNVLKGKNNRLSKYISLLIFNFIY